MEPVSCLGFELYTFYVSNVLVQGITFSYLSMVGQGRYLPVCADKKERN